MPTVIRNVNQSNPELFCQKTGRVQRLGKTIKDQVEALEQDLIERALLDYQGHITNAASRLGMNRTTLVEKMRKYDIYYQK